MSEQSGYRQPLPAGTWLREFELRRHLSNSGGFGIVYLSRNTGLDIPVAIKEYFPKDLAVRDGLSVVPKSAAEEEDYKQWLDRFQKEAKTLASFNHTNIVRIHDTFSEHNTGYIVMEYVEGKPLLEWLAEHGQLSEAKLRCFLSPLLEGVKEVHRKGLTHRDIKPGNIMMRTEGDSPVLLDFGLARKRTVARSQSMTRAGTKGYMPIEQYHRKGYKQGPWTDIYALGAVCYKALTGEAPEESIYRMLEDTVEPLETVCRGRGSPEFLRAVDWALRVYPDDRPQTLEDWCEALEGGRVPRLRSKTADSEERRAAQEELADKIDAGEVVDSEVWRAAREGGRASEKREERREEKPTPTAQEVASQAQAEEARRKAQEAVRQVQAEEQAKGLLLAGAEADLSAGRLTGPEGNNAWEKYQAVLRLFPGDARALAGMKRVLAEYMELFGKVLVRGDWDQAGTYLLWIRDLRPDSPFLAEGERRLSEAKAEAEAKAKIKAVVATLAREMVHIPGGRFRMGDLSSVGIGSLLSGLLTGDLSGEGDDDERPVHSVTVPSFWMGKYEVTFSQWDACVAGGGCSHRPDDEGFGRGNRPVVNVSWDDVQEFIAWLNARTDGGYRLPTESEWEYAARAGSKSLYTWGDEIGVNRANCNGCGSEWDNTETAPVGSFRASAWGLHDMHGNVWEWTEDCWNGNYEGAPVDGSAWLSGDCSLRVIRGGSWDDGPGALRSSNRYRIDRSDRYYDDLGFRLARDR